MLPSLGSNAALLTFLTISILPTSALIFELPSRAYKHNSRNHALSQKFKRDPTLPTGWSSLGCYSDGPARTLAASVEASDTMTVETCINYCATNNYIYAGVEYSQECYCDNAFQNGGAPATSGCDMMCAGDATETCGGAYRLNVYESSTPPPGAFASYDGWGYQGCYTDNTATRSLSVEMGYTAPLTPQKCLDACAAGGYQYAGLEYADQCFCDSEIRNGGALSTESTCDMICAGGFYLCGGANRLSLYEYGVAAITTGTTSSTTTSQSSSSTSTQSTTTSSSTSTTVTTSTTSASTATQSAGWTSLGCYTDNVNDRTLATGMGVTGPMTIEACQVACADYLYAGVEYADQCFCSNTILASATIATDGRCDMACAGDATEICGGPNGLNIFQNGATITLPSVLQTYGAWVSQGCYVDSTTARSLPVAMGTDGGPTEMTVQKCLDACAAASYTFAGLEYSQECYCGNTLTAQVATDGRCDMLCQASSNYCGGSYGLNVYEYGAPPPTTSTTTTSTSTTSTSTSTSASSTATGPTVLATYGNWQSQGCWSDSTATRSLSFTANTNGANTPQKCMDTCYAAGYDYAGVEYAAECYCGDAVVNGGALEPDAGCDMTCQADVNLLCGGPDRLNLYKYNGTVPPPVTPPPPPPAGGGDVGPVTTGLPAPWHYAACYVDLQFGRILGYTVADSTTNSAENCIAACQAQGFTLAGTEYTDECYCGNALQNGATQAPADTDCDMPCSGSASEACGGPDRISLYSSVQTFTTYPVPSPKTTGLPGEYQYRGCFAEPGGGQTIFKYQITDNANMSVQECLNQCAAYGYGAGALEYGTECWCGDADMVPASSAAAETDCDIPCVGSPEDICGGASRFTLYDWDMTTNPLYVWNTPANPGQYEFLIGGIVIPLIATLGINNKVSFLEKYGTGPPNSTGAYELDYTMADDFEHAWRTMHVSSDVFCAGNLVLPDRAGRVLSVGGWSYDSTEGVRLYTPSGSPGVNGTTDWEEFHDELQLQQGRWYPGSMVMANGSVMVVGGEEGSNGAPVPSIEILPAPEGGPTYLEMDWLLETDPNNLYPFLFVLPGGGIFVLYFNQARILDEVDFSTTKTFPTIPGAVNTAVAGRTYPMEGTSVLLPQYAPYTDPVEILTCGGSAFGQALDNCVSIVPEGAGEWVIERMPSKRVMTLMAPLPDGTYLILGGAEQGVAGFGLAIDPNLQALLYDPTQPRNQRFSILGTTIVARLYHSEATLLPDGRVMVTGSDPEDGVNPQEYRVEVYVPGYLTTGHIQPSYTIQERDWSYSGTYEINVTLPQGPISAMRISLIGAISSTHGNSFGQRTIFPAFTCQGNTCTITAPPDAHTCPPAWFQLFILDGPTPSHSQWVRIGGDPGQLGNWPNFPGFTLPGMGSI